MPYGLLSYGVRPQTLTVIKSDPRPPTRPSTGSPSGAEPDGSIPANTAIGSTSASVSERLAELWEVGEAVYSAMDPDAAEDAALDLLCQITGTTRSPATRSVVVASLTGTPLASIPLNAKLAGPRDGVIFQTGGLLRSVPLIPAWTATTPYGLGTRVTSSGQRLPQHRGGRLRGGARAELDLRQRDPRRDGELGVPGPGTASVDILAEAVTTPGRSPASPVSSRTIQTPTVGLLGANNLVAATVGADKETNAALRLRRAIELRGRGNATVDAIRRDIIKVGRGDRVRGDKLPWRLRTRPRGEPGRHTGQGVRGRGPRRCRPGALRYDPCRPSPQASRRTAARAAPRRDPMGIATSSSSRGRQKNIWIDLDVLVDPPHGRSTGRPGAGCHRGDAPYYVLGMDVRPWRIGAVLDVVPGILQVTAIRLGLAPVPVGTSTIPVGLREIARFDASRIVTINMTNGTP